MPCKELGIILWIRQVRSLSSRTLEKKKMISVCDKCHKTIMEDGEPALDAVVIKASIFKLIKDNKPAFQRDRAIASWQL